MKSIIVANGVDWTEPVKIREYLFYNQIARGTYGRYSRMALGVLSLSSCYFYTTEAAPGRVRGSSPCAPPTTLQ